MYNKHVKEYFNNNGQNVPQTIDNIMVELLTDEDTQLVIDNRGSIITVQL